MAKYIPTRCQICGSDMVLIQPAIKKGDAKSVARGECMQCEEEHEFTVLLNPDWEKEDNAGGPETA